MRRWLTLCLLALLPMQLSWAAVAGYCQHEAAAAKAAHFGHHEHDHQHQAADSDDGASAQAQEADSSDDAKSALALDGDCASCHLGCAHGFVSSMTRTGVQLASLAVPLPSTLPYDSHIPEGPERPDRRLA